MLYLFALLPLCISAAVECNKYMSTIPADSDLTMSVGCFGVVTTNLNSVSGTGTLFIGQSNTVTIKTVTASDTKNALIIQNEGTLTLETSTGNVRLFSSTDVKVMKDSTFSVFSASGISVDNAVTKLIFNKFYLNKDFTIPEKTQVTIGTLSSTSTSKSAEFTLQATGIKFSIDNYDTDLSYAVYPSAVKVSTGTVSTTVIGTKCTNTDTFTLENSICPCTLIDSECIFEVNSDTFTIPGSFDEAHPVTFNVLKTSRISGTGNLVIKKLNIEQLATATFNGFTSVTVNEETGSGNLIFENIKSTIKVTGTSGAINIIGGSANIIADSTTQYTGMVAVSQSATVNVYTRVNQINLISHSRVNVYNDVNDVQNVSMDSTSVVNYKGLYTKANLTFIKSGNENNLPPQSVIFDIYDDTLIKNFMSKIKDSNFWTVSCDGSSIDFHLNDITKCPCNLHNGFVTVSTKMCSELYSIGSSSIEMSTEKVITDFLKEGTLNITRPSVSLQSDLTVKKLIFNGGELDGSSDTKFTQLDVTEFSIVKPLILKNVEVSVVPEGVTTLKLIHSKLSVADNVTLLDLESLDIDEKSRIHIKNGQVKSKQLHLTLQTSSATKTDPIINSELSDNLIVTESTTAAITTGTTNVIAINQKSRTFLGSVPTGLLLSCSQRVFVSSESEVNCGDYDLSEKVCVVNPTVENPDLNNPDSYLDNTDRNCPCVHHAESTYDSCTVNIATTKPTTIGASLSFTKLVIESEVTLTSTYNLNIVKELSLSSAKATFNLGGFKAEKITSAVSTELVLNTKATLNEFEITHPLNLTLMKDTFFDKEHVKGDNKELKLDVHGSVYLRSGKFEVDEMSLYQTATEMSSIFIGSASQLVFTPNAKLHVIDNKGDHTKSFMTGTDVSSALKVNTGLSIDFTGTSSVCLPLATFASAPSSVDTESYNIKSATNVELAALGCSSKIWVGCPSKATPFDCGGSEMCVITSTASSIDSSVNTNYDNINFCPCTNTKSSLYTTGCEIVVPENMDNVVITNMEGTINKLTVSSNVKINTKDTFTPSKVVLSGKIEFTNEVSDILIPSLELNTNKFSAVTFAGAGTINSFTSKSDATVTFNKGGNLNLDKVGVNSKITVNSNSIVSGEVVALTLSKDMSERDLIITTKQPIAVRGEFSVRNLEVSRQSVDQETDKMNTFLVTSGNKFTVNTLKIIPSTLNSYLIATASDINYISIKNKAENIYVDKYNSIASYKIDKLSRDDIVCTMKDITSENEIVDIPFNDGNEAKSWDRKGCACDGEFCELIAGAVNPFVMSGINVSELNSLRVSGEATLVGSQLLANQVEQGQNLPITFSITKFGIDHLKISKGTAVTISNTEASSFVYDIEEQTQDGDTTTSDSSLLFENNTGAVTIKTKSAIVVSKMRVVNSKSVALSMNSGVIGQIEFTEMEINASQLTMTAGTFKIPTSPITIVMTQGQMFPWVIAPAAKIIVSDGSAMKIALSGEFNGDVLYLVRTEIQNFVTQFGVTIVNPKEQTKYSSSNYKVTIDASQYEVKQVCNIYVALVKKGYTVTECPEDPLGSDEAFIVTNTTNNEVPGWAIAIIVVFAVCTVIVLVLLILFVIYAKLVLLKNRKNNKVFNAKENIFEESDEDQTSSSSEEKENKNDKKVEEKGNNESQQPTENKGEEKDKSKSGESTATSSSSSP
ncbi:hypothetical protein EIN_495470 [Entamoeba invadens IP1]|uniref:Uncharacterized protein n=1 Tax=Entamoeba invadens IP1 TaxID=370355 RepID=A0A0A1TZN6_ENTIV|nr:hypothetical protein EIN_495470 [Entamoeba invadens IP1]ELP87092.1 hypothetical protein EIN_495470 [Entamoeba invadens IP1]|eukprot:XP_004253863.1 hypothetical protein EIN_495470 [Entamoeba invadens IP1]